MTSLDFFVCCNCGKIGLMPATSWDDEVWPEGWDHVRVENTINGQTFFTSHAFCSLLCAATWERWASAEEGGV